MPRISIDGVDIECRRGISVLQAALEAGIDVPHYCYHPGLSVVASCRLCLMEVQMRDPKTGEMAWAPKLEPSCQVPAREGLVVRFDSEKVRKSRARSLEFLLLNHPLDCPVCDQAGECLLQDYAYRFGQSVSRLVDEKEVNPKKDIGPRTLLYQDRCVMCTRCVRFAQEIAGTGELCVVNRGSRNEIDVFPGKPLDNPLQGNVVDVCPVGSMLDKDFLFKQRVWFLESAASICPGCSTGCAIRIDHHDDRVYRLKPRYNPGVNDWWMCDEGRFGWKHVHDDSRLTEVLLRRGAETERLNWESVPEVLRFRFGQIAASGGGEKIAVVLSPFLACEEAWLLVRALREVSPDVTLVPGPIPTVEQDQSFPVGAGAGEVKFVIRRERCPNRRGIELVMDHFGGPVATLEEFRERAGAGRFVGAWIAGGYPDAWVDKALEKACGGIDWLVVQDMFPSGLSASASLVLPMCSFAEREGSFVNFAGRIQPFSRAVRPPEGCKRDGQVLYELAGFEGLYNGARLREMMAQKIDAFQEVSMPPPLPVHQH